MKTAVGAGFIGDVTDDGMQWLDEAGKPPVVGAHGSLKDPFILTLYEADGVTPHRRERWVPPARLPLTPAALRATQRPKAPDNGAEADNTEGESMAVSNPVSTAEGSNGAAKPATKATKKKATKAEAPKSPVKLFSLGTSKGPRAAVKGSAATKPAGKGAVKNMDGQAGPSKPKDGIVYLRHMRSPRDAWILIKNMSVYGTSNNWATEKEFETAADAQKWAESNGLKVANKK